MEPGKAAPSPGGATRQAVPSGAVGYGIEHLVCMLISYVMAAVIDKVMYGISAGKMTLIVTDCAKEMAQRIDEVAGRGITLLSAEGSFSKEEKNVVMCAFSNKHMVGIRKLAKEIAPEAFIIIMGSN